MKRFKSKKTGTIDTKQPSPLKGGMSAEYLGMSPEDITAYIMGGIASGRSNRYASNWLMKTATKTSCFDVGAPSSGSDYLHPVR